MTYPEWSDIRNSNFARARFFHESITVANYEVIRLAFEIGKRGLSDLSFICIPPGSAVVYRAIVYVIMYLLAGRALAGK